MSVTPRRFSSRATFALTVVFGIPSSLAAALKLPACTTFTNTAMPSRSTPRDYAMGVVVQPNWLRQPRARSDDHRLNSGLERRMQHRSESRVVVGGDVRDLAGGFRLRIGVGVGSADEPKHGRDMPLRAEGAEILARRSGARVLDPVHGKIGSKCVRNALGRRGIVRRERVVIECRNLGRPRRARGGGLGVHDAL